MTSRHNPNIPQTPYTQKRSRTGRPANKKLFRKSNSAACIPAYKNSQGRTLGNHTSTSAPTPYHRYPSKTSQNLPLPTHKACTTSSTFSSSTFSPISPSHLSPLKQKNNPHPPGTHSVLYVIFSDLSSYNMSMTFLLPTAELSTFPTLFLYYHYPYPIQIHSPSPIHIMGRYRHSLTFCSTFA